EGRVRTRSGHLAYGRDVFQSGKVNGDDVVWCACEDARRARGVHGEGIEVARIHADHARAGGERDVELRDVDDLDEWLEVAVSCGRCEAAELTGRDDARDEEDGIRAVRAREVELDLVEDELLGEERRAPSRGVEASSRGREVGEASVEERTVAKHAHH